MKRGGKELRRLSAALRGLPIPVIGRIDRNAVVLDMRCLSDEGDFITNFARLDLTRQGP